MRRRTTGPRVIHRYDPSKPTGPTTFPRPQVQDRKQARHLRELRLVWAAVSQRPCPTINDIAAQLNMSFGKVKDRLGELQTMGYIHREPGEHAVQVRIPFALVENLKSIPEVAHDG